MRTAMFFLLVGNQNALAALFDYMDEENYLCVAKHDIWSVWTTTATTTTAAAAVTIKYVDANWPNKSQSVEKTILSSPNMAIYSFTTF